MMAILLLIVAIWASPAMAEDGAIAIAILTQQRGPVQLVSPLDREIRDEGLAGARLGIADNATTGRFTKQRFTLIERTLPAGGRSADVIGGLMSEGIRFVVADLDAASLLSAATEGHEMLFINARA